MREEDEEGSEGGHLNAAAVDAASLLIHCFQTTERSSAARTEAKSRDKNFVMSREGAAADDKRRQT